MTVDVSKMAKKGRQKTQTPVNGQHGAITLPCATDDVYCVRVYNTIRQGVSIDAHRLSVGRNLYPASTVANRYLRMSMESLTRANRFQDYDSHVESRERSLVAQLLNCYLKRLDIESDNIFFINGAQEGISVLCGFGAREGLAALIPLPVYYAFEQSSRRWGMPVAGYYRADGKVYWNMKNASNLMYVLVLPNPITGTLIPELGSQALPAPLGAKFTLIDSVFHLGSLNQPGLRETISAVVGCHNLERSAILLTTSKDLALPGLRAGVLVTASQSAMHYAKADRFERLYSVNPLIGQIIAFYTALLLINASGIQVYAKVREMFFRAGVYFPDKPEISHALRDFQQMAGCFRRNLRVLTSGEFPLQIEGDFEPVAGYSIFPRLKSEFKNSVEFIRWINRTGVKYALKLNPNYVFGGSPEAWDALYRGQYRIRINISEPIDELVFGLRLLKKAVSPIPGLPR